MTGTCRASDGKSVWRSRFPWGSGAFPTCLVLVPNPRDYDSSLVFSYLCWLLECQVTSKCLEGEEWPLLQLTEPRATEAITYFWLVFRPCRNSGRTAVWVGGGPRTVSMCVVLALVEDPHPVLRPPELITDQSPN